jgi:hypothetical protein
MNLPPQLLSPGAWTVHPLKGGAGPFADIAAEAWELGALPPDCGASHGGRATGWAIRGLGIQKKSHSAVLVRSFFQVTFPKRREFLMGGAGF